LCPSGWCEVGPRAASGATRGTTIRWIGAAGFGLAGPLFLAYPLLRPWTDETTLEGAAAFASGAWVVSHTMAMLGFLSLTVGAASLAIPSEERPATAGGRSRVVAAVLAWLGAGLVLPYYGAEAFGLQVIGARVVVEADPSLLQMAEQFRLGPVAATMFGAGLLALAGAGIAMAAALRHADQLMRAGGLLSGLGLATYLPQFFLPAAGRIGHGEVLALGLILLAAALWRSRDTARRPAGEPA
jgi:hypothetical protein